jgi:hypothetical protein
MALTSADTYIAATKNPVDWYKSGARTTVARIPFSLFDIAGQPGAGTLAVGNTANGLVHTDAVAGYPIIPAIAGIGYLTRVWFDWSVAGILRLYDRLFSAGAYAFNANVTLTAQPSFAGRVPGGIYGGLELWLEAVTAFTGSQSCQINYLDQGGVAGDTAVVATGVAPTVGRMFRMPLAAGDSGIQRLDQVRSTVSTVGTFNVHIMRKLWQGRVKAASDGDVHNMFKTGAPQVYADSALFVQAQADSTASGLPDVDMEICDA